MYLKKRLSNYIIQKLKKTSRLHNPKTNHAYEKRFLDYVIQKLITNLKKTYGFTKYYRKVFLEIRKFMEG